MAMRMPRFLKPSDHLDDIRSNVSGPTMRVLGDPAEIIPFPGTNEQSVVPMVESVAARAQVRTRRFMDHTRPEEDRYETSFSAASGSPVDLVRALMSLLEGEIDMHRPANQSEPLILDIRLIAG